MHSGPSDTDHGPATAGRHWEADPAGFVPAADDPDPVRVKGLRPQMDIFRKRGETFEHLSHGAQAHAGDVLQISYTAAGSRHGVIVSVDDRGVVTLHHPRTATSRSDLVQRGHTPLPDGYELDDAGGYERFIFVTSPHEPIDAREVLQATRVAAQTGTAESGPLALPSAWRQVSVTISKHVGTR